MGVALNILSLFVMTCVACDICIGSVYVYQYTNTAECMSLVLNKTKHCNHPFFRSHFLCLSFSQINLKILLVDGSTHTFLYPALATGAHVAQDIHQSWPSGGYSCTHTYTVYLPYECIYTDGRHVSSVFVLVMLRVCTSNIW